MSKTLGVISRGVKLPIIKSYEPNLGEIIIKSLVDASNELNTPFKNKDIICITESIVARSEGNYIYVDDIAKDIDNKFGHGAEIILLYPIFSRNRFSLILKGIARSASKIHLFIDAEKDEVGNDIINPFTGINIREFYTEIIESENCECNIYVARTQMLKLWVHGISNMILCQCHITDDIIKKYTPGISEYKLYTLGDICSTNLNDGHGYNEDFGLLGSNKASEEVLKLFPRYEACQNICEYVRNTIYKEYGALVEVMVYGDGCFKDPVGGIWEFADPVVSPCFTNGLEGTPNEIKIKYVADNESSDTDFVKEKIKNKESDLKGNMLSQGTTPRRYCDLIGSLADLTSGSGDKGTPIVWISNYFDNYAND